MTWKSKQWGRVMGPTNVLSPRVVLTHSLTLSSLTMHSTSNFLPTPPSTPQSSSYNTRSAPKILTTASSFCGRQQHCLQCGKISWVRKEITPQWRHMLGCCDSGWGFLPTLQFPEPSLNGMELCCFSAVVTIRGGNGSDGEDVIGCWWWEEREKKEEGV